MKLKQLAINLAVIPAVIGLALSTHNLQAEEKVETIEVHVEQENDQAPQVELIVNGTAEKFELAQLEKGETRTIVTESGKTITATKGDDGNTSIFIDGKEVKLFDFTGKMGANFNFIHSGDHHAKASFNDQIMIIGGNLSDEVKAAIKATLASYNVDKKVVFPDNSNANMMFISSDEVHTSGHGEDIDIEMSNGKRIKIIKEVNKD